VYVLAVSIGEIVGGLFGLFVGLGMLALLYRLVTWPSREMRHRRH
jgi:hypothetical protein